MPKNIAEINEDREFVVNQTRKFVGDWLSSRSYVRDVLLEKGSISFLAGQIESPSRDAILLAQYEYLVNSDVAAAKHWLRIPLEKLPANFPVCVQYLREGLDGKRPWDRHLLSLSSVESILCYVLLGGFDQLAADYDVVLKKERLFQDVDSEWLRPVIARHMILLSQGRGAEISEGDYIAPLKRDKGPVFRDCHLLLLAIARNDSQSFNNEIARRVDIMRRRKSSRLIEYAWGFGISTHWCFDVLGTAACRLAYRSGMRVENPDSRWFPEPFWRD